VKLDKYDGTVWLRTSTEDIIEPVLGEVTGEIPKWVKGSLLQNGPGGFNFSDIMMNHIFDGMAVLHRFNIENGNVTYQQRYLQSNAYKSITEKNRVDFAEFARLKDPEGNIFQR
jgi:carotenoid cleavage dioxygenase-like enzyme